MKLEQRMERSERLLETNEENKREVERSQQKLRQARSQVASSAAQVQNCRAQLQQAIAARNAAQQRAANDENGGSVPASYDAAVDSASAALSEANRELQEAQREQIRATDELTRAEAEQRASAEQLQSVVGELQAASEKYGVEMQKTAQLMSMPKGHLASPIMQQMGVGQAKVNDLCRRIAASLGITIAVSEGVTGTAGGLSSRLRGLSGGGAFGGGASYSGGNQFTPTQGRYVATRNGQAGAVTSGPFSGVRTAGLTQTRQSYHTDVALEEGQVVFDHPFDYDKGKICNQGSAYPSGPQQTCGCCASGTIVNKAGGSATEGIMVDTALKNGFCDKEGYTSADTIAGLLSHAGVPSSNTSGTSLEDLVSRVEQGKGVIVAVECRRFYPGSRVRGGHAVVLESVVRDAKTNKIKEYIVVDSNGRSPLESVVRVKPKTMEKAFRATGKASITTDRIIW